MHQVNLLSQKKDYKGTYEPFPLSISATEQTIGLYTSACFNCNVPKSFDISNAKNHEAGTGTKDVAVSAHQLINDGCETKENCISGHKIDQVTFNGKLSTEKFKLALTQYRREVEFPKMWFNEITGFTSSNPQMRSFYSDYSGYVGIAPWTADPDNKQSNFMWQLKDQGVITNQMISIYFQDKASEKSLPASVKFGSYDPQIIKNGPIKMTKTIDEKSWDLAIDSYNFGK